MERKAFVFQKPVQVMQVFRQIHVYTKEEKSFADRKEKLVWKEMASKNGYVSNGQLYLPDSVLTDKKFGNCDLITIEDEADVTPQHEWKMINRRYEKGNNHCFHLHHKSSYEIFWFRGKEPVELILNYSSSYVGDPSRDDFVLAVLEKDCPVEIKINGKIDSSRGRHFKEQHFVFELLGEFDSCFLLSEKETAVKKQLPAKRKLVNLLKPLW